MQEKNQIWYKDHWGMIHTSLRTCWMFTVFSNDECYRVWEPDGNDLTNTVKFPLFSFFITKEVILGYSTHFLSLSLSIICSRSIFLFNIFRLPFTPFQSTRNTFMSNNKIFLMETAENKNFQNHFAKDSSWTSRFYFSLDVFHYPHHCTCCICYPFLLIKMSA